jgi:DNA (cytosine-5)-methyltransferase 1
MRYLSVCSGIEAATVAWQPLGWEAAAFSEIEAFPRAVLAHHYPDTPLHGDFTTIGADEYGPVDLLVGGTPCQSFSVAGLRGGLDDDRGQLALQFLKLLDRSCARWVVWENVPGVLSSNFGRDFGAFLGGLAELGYGFAYRVLDAQFFGIPQRRRRVFVVGHLGDWRRAAAVLFERHSLSGHPAPRREKGQNIANAITERPDRGGGNSEGQRLIPSTGDVSHCLNAGGMGRQDYETETLISHSLRAEGFDASEDGTGRGTPLVPVCRDVAGALTSNYGKQPDSSDTALGPNLIAFTAKDHGADASDISPTLRSGSHSGSHANGGVMPAVAFDWNNSAGAPNSEDAFGTLATNRHMAAMLGSAVRRLTPRECERLQGFPDDYSLVSYRGKPAADGPRYKALGNSMAVPVMRFIGERIAMVEALAIADTHPEGGDGTKIAAPFMSSGGAKQSPNPSIQSTTP